MMRDKEFADFNAILAHNASVRAGAPAITLEEETWTYGQLERAAGRIAARLYSAGVRKGDRVGILLPNQPLFLGCLFGATRIGAVPVLINTSYGPDEILGILAHSQAKLLILQPRIRERSLLEIITEGRARGALPHIEAVWTASTDGSPADLRSAELWSSNSALPEAPVPTLSGDDLALFIYTSGTTGSSKGVMLSYRGLIENARITAQLMQYSDRDVLLPALPLFSSAGVSLTLISALSGTHIVVIDRNNPQLILETIERRRVTILDMVPSGLKLLMKYNQRAGHDTSSLRLIVVGGDSSPPEVGQQVLSDLGCNFAIVYGLTETSPVISITRLDDTVEQKTATVGPPIPGVELSIRDEQRRPAPPGQVGEICCRGPNVMPGYYRNSDGTRQCIDDEGWLYTGDLGFVRSDGRLVISGRKKDMILIGGHNVFPAEVEAHLFTHPGIKEVAVVGIERLGIGSYLVAYVVPKNADLDAEAVLDHCSRLASFKTPQKIEVVRELPYTGSGKVNKVELRRLHLES